MADTVDRRVIQIVVDGTDVARDTKRAVQSLSQLERQMASLRAATLQLRNVAAAGLGFAALAQSVRGFVSATVDVTKQYEQLRASLVTFEGGADAAAKKMAELEELNKKLPSSINELVSAYLLLKSQGLDASTGALVAFSDAAAATGKSLDQVVQAVQDAASGGGFERLKELGIRAKDLGDTVEFTFKGMTTTVKDSSEAITWDCPGLVDTENAFA